MVEGVFYKVVHGFQHPIPVTGKPDVIRPGQNDFLLLLLCTIGKMQLHIPQQFCNIFGMLFNDDRAGIQLCKLQQTLHQRLNPVQLLFGKLRKFLNGGVLLRFSLQQTVINVQGGKGRFQLMGNVRYGVFQKFLFPVFVGGMGV